MATLKTFVFDVETVPLYELSELWTARKPKPDDVTDQEWSDQQAKSMALSPEACQMVGLNVALGDGEVKSGWVGETNEKTGAPYSESDLLVLWWQWAAASPRLVGFNCNRFDLPVILTRSAILGVPPTVNLFNAKPWENRVVDVMERRFKGVPKDQWLSLKALRRLLRFSIPSKYDEVLDNTGGDIEQLYLRFIGGNDLEALRLLKLYGELDALTTRMLAQLFSGYYYQRID